MTAPTPSHICTKVVREYQRGATQVELASKYSLGAATVHRIIKSAGAERGRKFTADVLDAAVQDYIDSGDSIRTVAARSPISEDTLRRELGKRELTRPTGATTAPRIRESALNDYVSGHSVAVVAKRYGVARSTVSAWVDKEGLAQPDPGSESPYDYCGGWVRDGLILRPARPVRGVAA